MLNRGAKMRCPVCDTKYYWGRRQWIAWNEGKAIRIICPMCQTGFWAQKMGRHNVVTKERDE